jgi:hypothetical protein
MPYADKTKVPVDRSRAEIEKMIHKHGCSQYGTAVDYETGKVRVQFRSREGRVVRIEMEMPRDEQKRRTKWRALCLVLKAKLESVASKITTFDDEFMPHIVMPDGQTVGQHVRPAIISAYTDGKMPRLLLDAGEP